VGSSIVLVWWGLFGSIGRLFTICVEGLHPPVEPWSLRSKGTSKISWEGSVTHHRWSSCNCTTSVAASVLCPCRSVLSTTFNVVSCAYCTNACARPHVRMVWHLSPRVVQASCRLAPSTRLRAKTIAILKISHQGVGSPHNVANHQRVSRCPRGAGCVSWNAFAFPLGRPVSGLSESALPFLKERARVHEQARARTRAKSCVRHVDLLHIRRAEYTALFKTDHPLEGGPEPSKPIIMKVLFPIGVFDFSSIPVPKQIRPYHSTRCISWPGWS